MPCKPATRATPRAEFGKQIVCVGRHAEQEGGAGLGKPVEEAGAARLIVHDQLTAAGECGDQCTKTEIVAQGSLPEARVLRRGGLAEPCL
jgi:hypothetical protein